MASTLRLPARRAILFGTSSAVAGGSATAYLAYSENDSVRGFRRQARFWSKVLPVVAEYYWYFGDRSPYTEYRKWKKLEQPPSGITLKDLHHKHSPTVLEVMLELRGLYIKLGQVLSITTIPLPEVYREKFRTLQSDVPSYDFDQVIRPLLEAELPEPLDDIFESIDHSPCGAASIGQAHKATLKGNGSDVVLKVQYPDAAWQVPADIQCVGDLLKICVWTGVVDESAATLLFDDFSRQFLAELDYGAERRNLQTIYESSLDPNGPYAKHDVVVPQPIDDLCTPHILTMTYLPGPKLEEEAHRQLRMLGIDTKRDRRKLFREEVEAEASRGEPPFEPSVGIGEDVPWQFRVVKSFANAMGIDNIMWMSRFLQRVLLWSIGFAVKSIEAAPAAVVPDSWNDWAKEHKSAFDQVERHSLGGPWIDALLDVHGHQIFQLGLFNADPHPGNILVLENEDGTATKQLGLIDYGQCKRLTARERALIARLILAVANRESDEEIADAFRGLGIRTQNDSTEFLATFAKLSYGRLLPEHMERSWRHEFYKIDRIEYFPRELSMVYRTALLLRGLAISLGLSSSISDHWKEHAEIALEAYDEMRMVDENKTHQTTASKIEVSDSFAPGYVKDGFK